MKEMDRLVEIMETLRAPGGCPWDAEQDHKSIMKCLIEETYELGDAIESDNPEYLMEELGDVLLQVVFHSIIAKEDGYFTLADVIDYLSDKLVYRHPHVYGDVQVKDAKEVTRNWERLKRKGNGKENRRSIFDGIPHTLPALLYALKVQSVAGRVGFDWDAAAGVIDKIKEEIDELNDVMPTKDPDAMEAEIGDLFFSVVNLARKLKVDPEAALRRTNRKFMRRFFEIEKAAKGKQVLLSDMPLAEMEAIWERTKKGERITPGLEDD